MTAGRIDLTTQSYYEKISHKTACLIAACCKGGAIVSLASDEDIRFFYDYGMNLGIAFQIIDDILDYTEDQATIGKPAGNDLRQGMVTLPLIYALQSPLASGYQEKVQKLLSESTQVEGEIRAGVDWVAGGEGIKRSLVGWG